MSVLGCLHFPSLRWHRGRLGLRQGAEELVVRCAAATAIAFLSPLILPQIVMGVRINRDERVGKHGRRIDWIRLRRRNGTELFGDSILSRLIGIVRGEMNWVGPEARRSDSIDLRGESARRAMSVMPGLVSTWWVRERTNIAFGSQLEADLEYVEQRSVRHDFGVLVRSVLALAYGSPKRRFNTEIEILALPIDNLSMDDAVERILSPLEGAEARQVSFVNADCVNVAFTDEDYRQVLQQSHLRLGDGIGLKIAGSMLGQELRQNVNGTDLFPRLCMEMERRGSSLFLLGAKPGVVEDVAGWVGRQYPGLPVVGARHGYFSSEEESQILDQIRESKAKVLLVALGVPNQEKWIRRNLSQLSGVSAIGVGGLFDFYSGRIPRAPQWLREVGMEWTYRLYQEPTRMWRRYLLGNVVFLARVLRQRVVEVIEGSRVF